MHNKKKNIRQESILLRTGKSAIIEASNQILPERRHGRMAKASQVVLLENEFYLIKAPNGKVLEIKNFNTENGASIRLWDYAGHPWQQWQFVDAGEGRWRIRNRFTGKFIDLALGGVVEGYYAAVSAKELADSLGVEMPICEAMYDVLYNGAEVRGMVHRLMSRAPKRETDNGWV